MKKRRLIDANDVRNKAVPHTWGDHGWCADIRKWAVLVAEIDDAPTVDAVEVIRCKDCKFRDGTPGQPNILCYHMKDDDFCSYGERKNND